MKSQQMSADHNNLMPVAGSGRWLLLNVVAVALAFGLGACGGAGSACFNCTTGCCKDGVCVDSPFQTNESCGTGGAVCQACGAGTACQSGQCVDSSAVCTPSCDATTQDCVGGQCVAKGTTSVDVCGGVCAQCGGYCDATSGQCIGGNCSASSLTQCGPTNCVGCCDPTGRCIVGTEQTMIGLCGQSGQQCTSCAGQTLPAACAACGPGGVAAATQCCDGQQCVLSSGTTCGAGGLCQQCRVGEECVNGACRTPDCTNGCVTESGKCLQIGEGGEQSDRQCGHAGLMCSDCLFAGAFCDKAQGYCVQGSQKWTVCITGIVVLGGSWLDDGLLSPLGDRPDVKVTISAGGKPLKSTAAREGVKVGTNTYSVGYVRDCVNGISQEDLTSRGYAGAISMLVMDEDKFPNLSADDYIGTCNVALSPTDLIYGMTRITLTGSASPSYYVGGTQPQTIPYACEGNVQSITLEFSPER